MSATERRHIARRYPAALAAERLRGGLEHCGVSADVHEGYGVALVSVWADLLVWTDGFVYRWWTGKISERTGRRLYTAYGVDNPVTVARCVAHRYGELRKTSPRSDDVAECAS
ncbi:hypothetical protein ACQPYK_36380 [Streptosporangium sp. CA-135522]|uniref:hypothetical protein n=1 Tax=Streptosporangium sp. CA-135522 TaxID=3240072 RepID=UPI003D934E4D